MLVRFLMSVAFALASLAAGAAGPAATPQANKALNALFEREFRYELREHPEVATLVGVDDYDDRLTDRSPAAVARRRQHVKEVLRELHGFDPRRLNAQDRVSRQMMMEQLELTDQFNALYGDLPFSGADGWLVVTPGSGPQFLYAMVARAMPFRDVRDYEHYLKRLAAMPAALAQMTDIMRIGMRSGWMPPREIMTRVPSQFDSYFVPEVRLNPLYAPFTDFPASVDESERERLSAAARKVLGERVAPAFALMKQFLHSEYIPAGATALGASSLPGGKAYYALRVREATTTSLTPEQVHELGLSEVRRIHGEMDKLLAQIGFKGTLADYAKSIKDDPANYFTKPEDMLRAYRDIAKRVDAELPRLFAELPRLPYGVRAMDANEGDNAEHYTGGALDGSRAGYFEANVLSLSTRPIYEMDNTFLHEAVPGHHLQIARAQEISNLPAFRRAGGYVAYEEGWALYAESLGPELGLYKEPASRFGALNWEMVRACRLVLDTGMHAFGWSRERAIRYLMENTALIEAFAESEVDRYASQPGQALGYKIGELKIKELRERAKSALGARFDLRRFHNAVLDDGALPLSVLESRIDEWIAARVRDDAVH